MKAEKFKLSEINTLIKSLFTRNKGYWHFYQLNKIYFSNEVLAEYRLS